MPDLNSLMLSLFTAFHPRKILEYKIETSIIVHAGLDERLLQFNTYLKRILITTNGKQ